MGIVHIFYMFKWIFKLDWVHILSMTSNCGLIRSCVVVCISVFIEVLWLWSIFVIFLKVLFSCWIFIYEKWSSEGKIIQFSIMLHYNFSHNFFVKYTSNTVFLKVWNWWGPGSLKWSGLIPLNIVSVLILLIGVSVLVLLTNFVLGVLKLIWSILMLECIEKNPVDDGFNNWMGWSYVYIWYL